MAYTSRVIRLFISSTFGDFHAERNALQESVFPAIHDLCRKQGAHFQPIDLRWGVSGDAALDQRTLTICLEEVRRCRKVSPEVNFLALLGQHYGSFILPGEINAMEFELLLATMPSHAQQVIRSWFRRDDNAVPPAYVLQQRVGRYISPEIWNPLAEQMRQYFIAVCKQLPVSTQTALLFTASATELEITEGIFVPDRHDALCFFRTIEDLPITEDSERFVESPGTEKARRLQELKTRLRAQCPGYTFDFKAGWAGKACSSDHLQDFCNLVKDKLTEQVDRVLAGAKLVITRPGLTFLENNLQHFVRREKEIQEIEAYMQSNTPYPLILTGPVGSGKTTLLAYMAKHIRATYGHFNIYETYVGVTPDITTTPQLLSHLSQALNQAFHIDMSMPVEELPLSQQLSDRLAQATDQQPVLVIVDAIDQLRDNQHSWLWIPTKLPPHVHFVISIPAGKDLETLRHLRPQAPIVFLRPLSREDGERLLANWLERDRPDAPRTLQSDQREILLDALQTGEASPLYLRLAYEEARRWHSYDERIEAFPDTALTLLQRLFARLRSSQYHGHVLVDHTLGYLYAARNGLAEDELLDVLSCDQEVMSDFSEKETIDSADRLYPFSPSVDRLPVVIWSRLYFDLEPYLTERQVDDAHLINFYHRVLNDAIGTFFLEKEDRVKRHEALAQYFTGQELMLSGNMPNLRKLSEQAFQQAQGGSLIDLRATLTNITFLFLKIAFQSIASLLSDLALLPDDPVIRQIADVIRMGASTLASSPGEFFNQIYGRVVSIEALHDFFTFTGPGFVLLTPSLTPPDAALIRVFQGHEGGVTSCAFSPDGKTFVSGSMDGTLRLWNVETGEYLQAFVGHTDAVMACTFSPRGDTVLSGSRDGTLRLWNLETGECLLIFAYSAPINACAFSPDGQLAVSASDDQKLCLWNVQTGRPLDLLVEHSDKVLACAFSPDGQTILSASSDCYLILWDAYLCQRIKRYRNSIGFTCCVFSPDGGKIIGGSVDNYLHIYDLDRRGEKVTLWKSGHGAEVEGCAICADGQFLVSASADGTLRQWDLAKEEVVQIFFGHKLAVNSCAFHPNGQLVLSASDDGLLRLWDLSVRVPLRSFKIHNGEVSGCTFSHNGKLAATASKDGHLLVWDVASGECVQSFYVSQHKIYKGSFSPDDRYVLCSQADSSLSLWDLKKKEQVSRHFSPPRESSLSGSVFTCQYSPDGRYALSGAEDGKLRLWNISDGEQLYALEGHRYAITGCAFSPDQQFALSGSYDSTLRLWSIKNGTCIYTFREDSWVTDCAFSPDGQFILSALNDGTLHLWNVPSRQLVKTLRGHRGGVRNCAFSPDGRHCISVSNDQTLRLWDITTGEMLTLWTGDATPVSCAYHPKEPLVLIGDRFGAVHLLRIDDLEPPVQEHPGLRILSRITKDSDKRWLSPKVPTYVRPSSKYKKQPETGPGIVFRRDAFVVPFEYPEPDDQ